METININYIQFFLNHNQERKCYLSCPQAESAGKTHRQIFSEIKNLMREHKINKFNFANVTLTELKELCNLIIEEKIDIEWSTFAIVSPRIDKTLVDIMKKAGCHKINFDLFSGSDRLLNKLEADFTINDALSLFKICNDKSIFIGLNLIVGHPQETKQDFEKTINFLNSNVSFYGGIEKITYCLSKYIYFGNFNLPLCKNWNACLQTADKDVDSSFLPDFSNCISLITGLARPVMHIDPPLAAFSYLKRVDNFMIKAENLSFYFYKGQGHLFCKNRKLTNGLGIYSSIFAGGLWQDSIKHVDWQIEKINENKMVMKGRWEFLPLFQIWEIAINDRNIIKIKIEAEILKETIIDGEQQINIMLENKYNKWETGNKITGYFPAEFNDEWVNLFEERSCRINNFLKAESENNELPALLLESDVNNDEYLLSALNAPYSFESRILKCYRIKNNTYHPGKYLYFEGQLKIFY